MFFCLHAQIIRPSVLAKKATHISMSAGDTTTHWDNFRSGATDVSDEYDNVCICSHQIHGGCSGFSSLSQVGRWLILCAPAVCSCPKQKGQIQKLSSRTQHSLNKARFSSSAFILDDAGPPACPDRLTAIFDLN